MVIFKILIRVLEYSSKHCMIASVPWCNTHRKDVLCKKKSINIEEKTLIELYNGTDLLIYL